MAKTPVSQEEIQLRKRARRRLVGAIALVLHRYRDSADGSGRRAAAAAREYQHPDSAHPATGSCRRHRAGPTHSVRPSIQRRCRPHLRAQPRPSQRPLRLLLLHCSRARCRGSRADAAGARAGGAASGSSRTVRELRDPDRLFLGYGQIARTGRARSRPARSRHSASLRDDEHTCTRVRAGPFPNQEAAHSARERLLKLKLIPPPSEGKIVRRGD